MSDPDILSDRLGLALLELTTVCFEVDDDREEFDRRYVLVEAEAQATMITAITLASIFTIQELGRRGHLRHVKLPRDLREVVDVADAVTRAVLAARPPRDAVRVAIISEGDVP